MKTIKCEQMKADCKAIAMPVRDRMIKQNSAIQKSSSSSSSSSSSIPARKFTAGGRFLAALLLAFSLSTTRAAVVNGYIHDITTAASDTAISFYPSQDILTSPLGLSAGPAKTIYSTNGSFSLTLDAGNYVVRVPLVTWRKPFTIAVPVTTSTNAYNITNLIATPWTYEDFTETLDGISQNFATTNGPAALTNIIQSLASGGSGTVSNVGPGLDLTLGTVYLNETFTNGLATTNQLAATSNDLRSAAIALAVANTNHSDYLAGLGTNHTQLRSGQATNHANMVSANATNHANAIHTGGRELWVAPWGSDTTGNGSFAKPFRTVYDALEIADEAAYQGAYSIAGAGDTIILTPDTHYLAAIPLPDNVNLWIQPGAVVIRCNFSNATVSATPSPAFASLTTVGPFIIPGENSTIDFRGATVISTNNTGDNYDAGVGWWDSIDTWQFLAKYSFTNAAKSGVTVLAGNAIGTSDFWYFNQTNTAQSSVEIYGGKTVTGWDAIRAESNLVLRTFFTDMFATNTHSQPVDYYSRAAFVTTGVKWTDVGSSFGSGGGTNQNFPIYNGGSEVVLNNTRLYRTSAVGQNVTNASGGTTTGNYLSGSYYVGSLNASNIVGFIPTNNLPWNAVTPPAGLVVTNQASLFVWDGESWTPSTNALNLGNLQSAQLSGLLTPQQLAPTNSVPDGAMLNFRGGSNMLTANLTWNGTTLSISNNGNVLILGGGAGTPGLNVGNRTLFVTNGLVGINKVPTVGLDISGILAVSSYASIGSTIEATHPGTGALSINGGLGVLKQIQSSSNILAAGTITSTNGFSGPTNPAPTSVTIGTTAPDAWFAYKGTNGVTYKVPAWFDH